MAAPSGDRRLTNPFKSLDSFEEEDAGVFFGRDPLGDQVVARMIGHQLTILHARSGAGKTSLLNARVVPALLRKGWVPVRTTPGGAPTERTRDAVLTTLLPSSRDEQEALEQLWRAHGKPETVGDLSQVVRKGSAVRISAGGRRGVPLTRTWTSRFLRGGVSWDDFLDHLSALYRIGHGREPIHDLDPRHTVAELFDVLTGIAEGHQRVVQAVKDAGPRLATIFLALQASYGRYRDRFRPVLILDQFEELFTLLGSGGDADWRPKWDFFDQLREIWETQRMGESPGEHSPLFIRFVLSLRSDYLTDLEPLRAFAEGLDEVTFQLPLLNPTGGLLAVRGPVSEVHGFDVPEETAAEIVQAVTAEERYVEAPSLQVVCYTLWEEWQDCVAAGKAGSAPSGLTETLTQLNGPKGILNGFLRRRLAALGAGRLSALEMLAALVTRAGTRNIVEQEVLVGAPFRSRGEREQILQELERQKIVRIEKRLKGRFVEIAHEFLVTSIVTLTREESAVLRVVDLASRALQSFERGEADEFSALDWAAIDEHTGTLLLPPWAIEEMLRASLSRPPGSAHADIRRWLERYDEMLKQLRARDQVGLHALYRTRVRIPAGEHAGIALEAEPIDEADDAIVEKMTRRRISLLEWRVLAVAYARHEARVEGRAVWFGLIEAGLRIATPDSKDQEFLRTATAEWNAS